MDTPNDTSIGLGLVLVLYQICSKHEQWELRLAKPGQL